MLQINKNIKLIRELSGKTQKEFAKLIKSNLSNVKTYETSDTRPKAPVLAAICDFADITLKELEEKELTHKDLPFQVDKVDDPATVILPTGDVKRTLADYIAIIELYNKTLSGAINAGLIDLKNTLKEAEANLARGQQEIKEQILVTAMAAVQQLSGQVPGVSVPLTGEDKGIGGKKKVGDGDGKNKDQKP